MQHTQILAGNGWTGQDENRSESLLLVRLSAELTTKARGTRRRFQSRLARNMADALTSTGAPFRIEPQWTRIFVRTAALAPAVEVLSRVPGLSSLSVVEATCEAELDAIVRVGRDTFADRVRGRSYAVRARRAGQHSFRSADVQRQLGAALNEGAHVDLSDPDVEVEVEIRDRSVYFFSGRTDGLGGLPLGVEGRAVCLLSGGFDSVVAAWLMLKRGVELDYVFCNLAGETHERSVVEVARVLAQRWSYGTQPRLYVVPFEAPVEALRQATAPKFWQLILKRLMYRAAATVGHELRASAIVTGEAIGQVSSQTLANLGAIDPASDLPVLRPLLGFDKTEIIDRTRRIGSYELSSRIKEYCAIAPGNPVTSATPGALAREEAQMQPGAVARALGARTVLDLRGMDATDLVRRYVFTEEVPEDAIVIDLRPEEQWQGWHHPRALLRDRWAVLGELDGLDPDARYVVYCEQGMQSAQLAEQLQDRGFDAAAFRGGLAALKRQAAAPGG